MMPGNSRGLTATESAAENIPPEKVRVKR